MIKSIEALAFKIKYGFLLPIRKDIIGFLSSLFAPIGSYYTFCEVEKGVFGTSYLINFLSKFPILFIVGSFLFSVLMHRQSLNHNGYLGNKDVTVSLRMANLLSLKETAVVIPTNTTFDTTMNSSFISEKSIQGQFQRKQYGVDFSELDEAIKKSLEEFYPDQYETLNDRLKTNRKRYGIGAVARVTRDKKHYYFLAVADVNRNGKPENVTMQSMVRALVGLWDFLSKEGYTEPIAVPVIGTGRAGLKDGTFEKVVHETIFSFIAKAQEEFVAKKMTICVYPQALSEANVTWKELCDYLDLQCRFGDENQRHAALSENAGIPLGLEASK